jgi:hypothetical protein
VYSCKDAKWRKTHPSGWFSEKYPFFLVISAQFFKLLLGEPLTIKIGKYSDSTPSSLHPTCSQAGSNEPGPKQFSIVWVVAYIRSFWSVKRTCPPRTAQNGRR